MREKGIKSIPYNNKNKVGQITASEQRFTPSATGKRSTLCSTAKCLPLRPDFIEMNKPCQLTSVFHVDCALSLSVQRKETKWCWRENNSPLSFFQLSHFKYNAISFRFQTFFSLYWSHFVQSSPGLKWAWPCLHNVKIVLSTSTAFIRVTPGTKTRRQQKKVSEYSFKVRLNFGESGHFQTGPLTSDLKISACKCLSRYPQVFSLHTYQLYDILIQFETKNKYFLHAVQCVILAKSKMFFSAYWSP